MFDFKIMVRSVNATKTQQAKTDMVNKLLHEIGKGFDPLHVCFDDKLKVMGEWFCPKTGKIKNLTQHWDESIVPESGLNLIVSARALTMENIHEINKYLRGKK